MIRLLVKLLWGWGPRAKRCTAFWGANCCKGLRSAFCMDGRCRFHCKELCKCEHDAATLALTEVAEAYAR